MQDQYLNWYTPYDMTDKSDSLPLRVVWYRSSNTSDGNGQTWTITTEEKYPDGIPPVYIVDRLDLFFNGDAASQIWILDPDHETSSVGDDKSNNYVVVKGGKDASAIKADFEKSSLGESNNNRIDLHIDFGKTTNKTIEVNNLKDLYGDLYIASTGAATDSNTYKMDADNIYGNINVSGNNNSFMGTVTIKELLHGDIQTNSASLEGGNTPSLKVVFEDKAKMIGSIKGIESGQDGIKREITFKGEGKVLEGSIISFGTENSTGNVGFNADSGNFVTFEKGSMKGSIIASGGKSGTITHRGQNVVTFGTSDNTATTHTIEGGILAELITSPDWGNNYGAPNSLAKNIINVEKKNTLNITGSGIDNNIDDKAINGNGSTFSVPKGGITARGFASNEINLNEGSTINLDNGNGVMDTSLDNRNEGYGGPNTKSILTFKGKDGTFNGKILSDGSNEYTDGGSGGILTTNIIVNKDASGTITGDITQNSGGKNMIELGVASAGTNTEVTMKESSDPAASTVTSTLTLQGATNQIEQVKATSAATLFIDGSKHNGNKTTINSIDNTSSNGQNLTITFKEGSQNKNLAIKAANGSGTTIKALTLESGSTNNTFDPSLADSTNSKLSITEKVSVDANQSLNIRLKRGELSLNGGIETTNGGRTHIIVDDLANANGQNSTSGNATLSGGNGNTISSMEFKSSDKSKSALVLKTNLTINGDIKANGGANQGDKELLVDAATSAITAKANSVSGGGLFLNLKSTNSNKAMFEITGTNNSHIKTLGISNDDKATSNFSTFKVDAGRTTVDNLALNNKQINLEIGGTNQSAILEFKATDGKPDSFNNVKFDGSNSTLGLATNNSAQLATTINKLESTGTNNTINLSGQAYNGGNTPARDHFQTLTITNLDASKSMNFIVYVNPNAKNDAGAKADRIIIEGVGTNGVNSNKATTHYLAITGNAADIVGKDLYKEGSADNIALATVKNSGDTPIVNLQTTKVVSGFSVISFDMVSKKTDKNGKVIMLTSDGPSGDTYTTYFLGTRNLDDMSFSGQKTLAAALGTTYDLYLANMNSLNKRMGELRDNPKGQGVWARVFTGLQTSKFALQTNSFYTTIQGGYDYAFGFNGANNYLGFAVSYANSITGAKMSNDHLSGINSVNSNAVEFAIYNAYVQDGASSATGWKNGLYTDSIIKFSYINSSISLKDGSMIANSYATNSFAFTLSQEVGYRFILGQSNEWYIDPQAELAFGYLDQSNFKQKLSNSAFINGIQDSIFTLRGRVGSSFGYKFDKFTEGKNFKAQAY